MAASQFALTATVLFEAQVVIVGADAGFTVTLNVQLELWLLQVTTVVPAGKVEPEAGLQVTVPQSPFVVGSG
jgi:hypothetical protein